MSKKSMALMLVLCLSLVPLAHAQIGAIINILGGGYTAGKAQQDKERMDRERDAWQQQREAERIEQEELRRADRAQQQASLEAKRIEDERKSEERAEAVRAKRIQPATLEDLDSLYDPDNGWDIAASPKVKPDRSRYIISGTISRNVSDTILLCETVPDKDEFIGHYFTVKFSKKTKKARDILDRMRIGGSLFVVGKYIANINYQTVAGAWKVMPVFDADHLIVPDGID